MPSRSYHVINDIGGVELKQFKIGDSVITFSKNGITIKAKEVKHGHKIFRSSSQSSKKKSND